MNDEMWFGTFSEKNFYERERERENNLKDKLP